MKMTGEILVVDDDAHLRDWVVKLLTREDYAVRALPRGQDMRKADREAIPARNGWRKPFITTARAGSVHWSASTAAPFPRSSWNLSLK